VHERAWVNFRGLSRRHDSPNNEANATAAAVGGRHSNASHRQSISTQITRKQ